MLGWRPATTRQTDATANLRPVFRELESFSHRWVDVIGQ